MTTTQELLESSFGLNLNNYGPEDVERLNDWAINAHNALEAARAEIERQTHSIQGLWMERDVMRAERDTALAQLAITKETNSILLARNKWLGHTLAVAGASPVKSSAETEGYSADAMRNYARAIIAAINAKGDTP